MIDRGFFQMMCVWDFDAFMKLLLGVMAPDL